MKWNKKGLIFEINGQKPWMKSHGTHPLSLKLDEVTVRVFFSSRSKGDSSHIGFFDYDVPNERAINLSENPVLSPGPLGAFDDQGTYTGSIVQKEDGTVFLYYLGWNSGKEGSMFYSYIGLAVSRDMGQTFTKYKNYPLLDRNQSDPFGLLIPFVLREGNEWKMWYGSTIKWEKTESGLKSYYNIRYATSHDGLEWQRDGEVAIDLLEGESNVAHPFVIKNNEGYHMWYSLVKEDHGQYQPGYAFSQDGRHWDRLDNKLGLEFNNDPTENMANSHMNIFEVHGKYYMLYNGNRFGYHGVHMASARRLT